jgi:hypothetical protein
MGMTVADCAFQKKSRCCRGYSGKPKDPSAKSTPSVPSSRPRSGSTRKRSISTASAPKHLQLTRY